MGEYVKETNDDSYGPRYKALNLDTYPGERDVDYVVADRTELQLDMDTEEQLAHFKKMWRRFSVDLGVQGLAQFKSYEVWDSRTPGHYHVYVTMRYGLSTEDRVMLQAAFGSDLVRELRNWGRAKQGLKDPVLLRKRGPNARMVESDEIRLQESDGETSLLVPGA